MEIFWHGDCIDLGNKTPKEMKFTARQFHAQFPDDDACLHKIFTLRFGNLTECQECKKAFDYKRVNYNSKVKGAQKKSYQCIHCGNQIYPLAGTIFQQTTTSLKDWFYILYLFTTTRNGVSAKEIERQLDVCYKTALRMAHQLKKLMGNRTQNVLSGFVQADEMIPSMKAKNMHAGQRQKAREVGFTNKEMVFGMIDDKGELIVEHVKYNDWATIRTILAERVSPYSVLITDGAEGYNRLREFGINFINHVVVNHQVGEYVKDGKSTNTIEGFWSQLRRMLYGTHIKVSPKHLNKYIQECATRYMLRKSEGEMFDIILKQVA